MANQPAFTTPFSVLPQSHRNAPVQRRRPAPRNRARFVRDNCAPRMTIALPSTPTPKTDHHTLSPRVAAFLSRSREGDPMKTLQFAERAFNTWKSGPRPYKQIVHDERGVHDPIAADVDVAIAGGTLGVFYATALAARGVRVALIERGQVQGRAQEWNISRAELESLVEQGVLTRSELDAAIVGEFPAGSRIAFPPSDDKAREINVKGVLDLGVNPAALVAAARARFESLGGVLLEHTSLERVDVRENNVAITMRPQQRAKRSGDGASGAGGTSVATRAAAGEPSVVLRSRLLVDAMGVFSPIAAQVREGASPDGACIVVGSCVQGLVGDNNSSDLLCAIDDIDTDRAVQYFWEAFPAGSQRDRRTTYMFSYGPCDNTRQTLTEALDDYVRLLPKYQPFDVRDVEVERALFAFFPVFRDSPTQVKFDRVLPVGDAAGFQSPISFGGFGACLRHLGRVADGVEQALASEDDALLTKKELQRMQFYNPSLSVTWLFNSAMAVKRGNVPNGGFVGSDIINDLLYCNMTAMQRLGDEVQKPFLQDVVRAGGLTKTILAMMVGNPLLSARTAAFVNPVELLKWTPHYLALVLYTILAPFAAALQSSVGDKLDVKQSYRLNRLVDSLRYGSGLDHELNE